LSSRSSWCPSLSILALSGRPKSGPSPLLLGAPGSSPSILPRAGAVDPAALATPFPREDPSCQLPQTTGASHSVGAVVARAPNPSHAGQPRHQSSLRCVSLRAAARYPAHARSRALQRASSSPSVCASAAPPPSGPAGDALPDVNLQRLANCPTMLAKSKRSRPLNSAIRSSANWSPKRQRWRQTLRDGAVVALAIMAASIQASRESTLSFQVGLLTDFTPHKRLLVMHRSSPVGAGSDS